MTELSDYFKATNSAYDTLIKYKVFSFPVNPTRIIQQLDWVALHTYYDLIERRGFSRVSFLDFFASSEFGFTAKNKTHYIIFYNEQKDQAIIRFTLAHELGHVILGHTVDGDKENKEANCFARNLLCPIPVITEMGLHAEVQYVKAFNVSERMARCAIKHKDSDYYYITRDRYITYNSKLPYENTITTTTFSDISYQTACTTSLPGLCPVTRVFPYPIPF